MFKGFFPVPNVISNCESGTKMKNAIWPTFYHKRSTDEELRQGSEYRIDIGRHCASYSENQDQRGMD
ncbi:hypothetical protein V1478_000091 [Vespula squamosa]|uniref:Uncharacterized protein n=1 Tax=Vespula squamosa TaxID=30214 RepID=A0ABD2C9W6_VESSQ